MSVFPKTGLPNRIVAVKRVDTGAVDAYDNPIYGDVVVFDRPARFYRDAGRELMGAQDTDIVEGMVTFPAERYDMLDMLPVKSEILLKNGQYPLAGSRFHVIHPRLMETWSKPSHWEISIGRTR